MLKRLIEVALPLKEVSEQSAREKSIRHGHISTLHIWWARRPLAACRAVVFASLIPDPEDPECPESFRAMVRELLGRGEFKPKGEANGEPIADTPRNRCLEFIKSLVRWENSNNPEYNEPARKLIAAAHKILHPDATSDAPKVLDPFAGGGAIPLEALRLGCEAHAIDLNPVAHLIELCTLVYPQKYGQPDSRPVPDYIKRLIAHNRARKQGKDGAGLFDKMDAPFDAEDGEIIPDVEITEAEYRKNPLAADVKYWGHWILRATRGEIGRFYPSEPNGSTPLAYLWCRTVRCSNPACAGLIPLVKQLWLCNKQTRRSALRMIVDSVTKRCFFEVVRGKDIDFDPKNGTMRQGGASCPFCSRSIASRHLRQECRAGRMGEQMMAVALAQHGNIGKLYRSAVENDLRIFNAASEALAKAQCEEGVDIIPNEPIPCYDPRRVSPPLYGLDHFKDLFNQRQLLCLTRYVKWLKACAHRIQDTQDQDYCRSLNALLALAIDWVEKQLMQSLLNQREKLEQEQGRLF